MIEDGSFAGEGFTILETLTYFVIAPTALFIVISFFAYITAKETRKKSKKSPVDLTHIQ
jgi:hypothetical protein